MPSSNSFMYDASRLQALIPSRRITTTHHNDMSLHRGANTITVPHLPGTPQRRAICQTSCDRSGLTSNVIAHACRLMIGPRGFSTVSLVGKSYPISDRQGTTRRKDQHDINCNKPVPLSWPPFCRTRMLPVAVISYQVTLSLLNQRLSKRLQKAGVRGGQSFAILDSLSSAALICESISLMSRTVVIHRAGYVLQTE